MTQIRNNINTYADLTAYNADLNKEYPNVSYIQGTDEVKMYKYDPDHIVCVYDVTSTESATKLLYFNSGITYQIIDGVQQQSVQTTYTFDTLGEHIVKYKLSGTSINDTLFRYCSNITSVIIPYGITNIGGYTFADCGKISNAIIPNSVTTIVWSAFRNCSSLSTITIPDSVTLINQDAFQNCTTLTSVTIEATTPPTLGTNAFNNTNNCPIYVPAESVETYKAASGWSDYASRIQAIPNS